MTCEVCRAWTAMTWDEHASRLRNLRDHAKTPARCPRCNGQDWATAPPPLALPRENAPSAGALVALTLIAAVAVVLLALFGRLA
jgi:hypothetical protein